MRKDTSLYSILVNYCVGLMYFFPSSQTYDKYFLLSLSYYLSYYKDQST